MFPHTVTIINISNDEELICKVVENAFYISERIISQEGNGEKYTNTHRCIFSKEAIELISNEGENPSTFSISINDIVVKGIVNVESMQQLKESNVDFFKVKTISDNSDYGIIEDLKNIEVTD